MPTLTHAAMATIPGADLRVGDVLEHGTGQPLVLKVDGEPSALRVLGPGSAVVYLNDRPAPTVIGGDEVVAVRIPRPDAPLFVAASPDGRR